MQRYLILRLKKLSVIIVSYNVCYFLELALLSVRKALQQVDAEVFVVDNNSADHTVKMVRESFPEVKLICNKINLGFSKANNQAICQATGKYILLLNPDTVVAEDTFTCCLQFMDRHPEAGGLGVKMLDGQGRFLPESLRGLPTPATAFYKLSGLSALFPRSRVFGRYYLGYLDASQVQEVDVLAGAFMLLRQECLQQTGLLDESFFMYGEDIDLSYRLQKAGYKNFYLPHTQIIHYKGESTRRGSLNYVYQFYRAMAVFVQKHFSGWQAALLTVLVWLAMTARGLAVLSGRLLQSQWRFIGQVPGLSVPAKPKQIAVAGSAREYQRVGELLQAAGVPSRLAGFFSPDVADQANQAFLGDVSRLREVCRSQGLDELIFSCKDFSFKEIITWMRTFQDLELHFMILPEGRPYIIGSHSKNSPGRYYVFK